MTRKQIIIISVVFLIIIGGGLTLYFLYFRMSSNEIPPVIGQNTTSQLPTGASRTLPDISNIETSLLSLKKLSDRDVFYSWLLQNELYYLALDGSILNAKEGDDSTLSSQVIEALRSAVISPQRGFLLVSFGDPFSPQWTLFDTIDRVWRPLPADITEAAWGGNDQELFVVIGTENGRGLASMDISKNPPTTKMVVRNFLFNDVFLSFLSPQTLLISERSSSEYPGRTWQLNTKTLTLNTVFESDYNVATIFNRDFSSIIRSSDKGLTIYTPLFAARTSVLLPTFPTKCAFENDKNILCFVPQIPLSLDSYLKKEHFSTDDVYSISLANDSAGVLVTGGLDLPAIDASNVSISDTGDVFFVNRYDRSGYRLRFNTAASSIEEGN